MFYDNVSFSIIGREHADEGGSNQDSIICDGVNGIYILADGMGGKNEGDVSSYLATKLAHFELLDVIKRTKSGEYPLEEIPGMMQDIFMYINQSLTLLGHASDISSFSNPRLSKEDFSMLADSISGMGTTLDAFIILDGLVDEKDDDSGLRRPSISGSTCFYGHVGNGRLYHKKKTLQKITEEHTSYGMDPNELDDDSWSILEHDQGLTNFIGMGKDLYVDTGYVRLAEADVFLGYTDGVSGTVSNDEVRTALNDFSRADKIIKKRVRQPDSLVSAYQKKHMCSIEIARNKLKNYDDASLIAVRRVF